jgi:hypothetical protein
MSTQISKRIRDLTSTIIILILLGLILGFYYIKYVPDNRRAFHRNAFLELNQMENALQSRNTAFRDAIRNIISQKKIDSSSLLGFNYRPGSPADSIGRCGCFHIFYTGRHVPKNYRAADLPYLSVTIIIRTVQ